MTEQITTGDVVYLKSGGPTMKVIEFPGNGTMVPFMDNCVLLEYTDDEGVVQNIALNRACLTKEKS